MALVDIIARIEGDAESEAAQITRAADERVAAILAVARDKAAAHTAATVANAEASASREAGTIVVNARLRARDEAVAARRALVEEALTGAAESIAALPDDRYAEFLGARIAAAVRGGEKVAFGSADAARAGKIAAAVKKAVPDVSFAVSDASAPFERGALLTGDRVQADLSLRAIVEDRRDELEMAIASVLFDEEA